MSDLAVSRRSLLATAGTVSLAGCVESLPSASSEENGISLGTLFVSDHHDGVHYQIQLKRDNEIVYHGELEVDSERKTIDPTWSTEPAEYTLIFATADTMHAVSIPDDVEREMGNGDADCYHPEITRRPHGIVVDMHSHEELVIDEGIC